MPGTGFADLWTLADQYLAACYFALQDTPAGPPGRYYVSPGPPPLDCEQLTVYVAGPNEADTFPLTPVLAPGHRIQNQGMVNLVTLVAQILRCIPIIHEDGEFPSVAEMNTASYQQCADMWAIWNHVRQRVNTKTLFTTISDQTEVFLDPAFTVQPQGGFGGWNIQVRVALQGYVPSPA